MSALELNKGKPSGSEESLPPETAGSPASVESDGGAAGAATSESSIECCTLVAKWQGNLIELPILPKSTTIGEVKASARWQLVRARIMPCKPQLSVRGDFPAVVQCMFFKKSFGGTGNQSGREGGRGRARRKRPCFSNALCNHII